MHEGGMQIFEGDGLLTTPETTAHKQGKAIIPVRNGRAKKGISKNPIAPAKGSSGETPSLIASVNAAASGSHQRNTVRSWKEPAYVVISDLMGRKKRVRMTDCCNESRQYRHLKNRLGGRCRIGSAHSKCASARVLHEELPQ